MEQLNIGTLSEREIEILDCAIRGLTDQQIGAAINISPSTVNSYWVRIRGKLGHLSRTELVSRVVQQRAQEENSNLRARIAQLEAELAWTKTGALTCENADLLRVAFESHAEATFILSDDGAILLASERACQVFGLSPREMAERSLWDLLAANSRDSHRMPISNLTALEKGTKLGLDFALFAKTATDSVTRVFLILIPAARAGKEIVTCVVRPFAEELQIRLALASMVLADAS